MRDTFEWIDGATRDNDDLRHALYDLGAQVLASQAFALACATMKTIDEHEARQLVEKVAGYPGVTGRQMRPGSETRVGDRAAEVVISLAKDRPGFVRP
ncbi:hypothetical protein OZ411_01465 [Bradyrhizobium sp. Arg237L]|uniref:hypothetical protein n=1 Tax=Bradyrhizobium sp. Arg237L TaxID=3003352 RepID=UPI00249D9A8E|nr:hypothetical protein [Bradyrhizobium sp. Arg237L]MDI4231481.1 hypothetical protein [Bradyrhizobium sp. Arg237L]